MSVSNDVAILSSAPHSTEETNTPPPEWSSALRFAFRFAFSLIVIYNFPDPLDSIPWIARFLGWALGWFDTLTSKMMSALVPWVGTHVFHTTLLMSDLQRRIRFERYGYVQIFCDTLFAILIAVIWSLLDRKRKNYTRLHDLLRVYVRYVLAASMFVYGFSKVMESQMPFPSLDQLVLPLGISSAMGFLWKFIGYSTVYQFFCGVAELLGGTLVLFRRTTTLGALITAAVMINVTLMNFCYDIWVKINSSRLLFLAIFLLLPDLYSLYKFFILKRTTTPTGIGQTFTVKWMKITGWVLKAAFIGYLVFFDVSRFHAFGQTRMNYLRRLDGKLDPKYPIFGIYQVEEFNKDGQVLPPMTTDTNRWDKLIFYGTSDMNIRSMTDSELRGDHSGKRYVLQYDAAKNTVTLSPEKSNTSNPTGEPTGDESEKDVFTYSRPDADHLILQGKIKDDSFVVKTKRIDQSMLLIQRRGFHWVTDQPVNH